MDYIDHAIEADIAREEKAAAEGVASESESEEEAVKVERRKRSVKDFGGSYKLDKSRGVMYLGHIPDGFMEAQMRKYFKQYGSVHRIRLSRNRSSGKSRGYAFIEFESPEVAEVVAKTMNGYMMFKRTLQAKVVPNDKLHRRMWCGMGISGRKHLDRRNDQNNRHVVKMTYKRFDRLHGKETKRNQKLAEMGIDYKFEGFSKTENKKQLRADAQKLMRVKQEPVEEWKKERAERAAAHEAANAKAHEEAVQRKIAKKEGKKQTKLAEKAEVKKEKAVERQAAKEAKNTKKRKQEDALKKEMEKNESVIKEANKEVKKEQKAKVSKKDAEPKKVKKVKK